MSKTHTMAKKPNDDLFEGGTMTFGEHLEELRVCLFRGVIGIVLGCMVGFFVANGVVRFFQGPLERAMEQYYIKKAVGELSREYGEDTFEIRRMILDQKLIPELQQLDISRLGTVLGLTFPQQFGELKDLSPYWYTFGDFRATGPGDYAPARQIAAALREAAASDQTSARTRMATMLREAGTADLFPWVAVEQPTTASQAAEVLAALNTLAGMPELHDSPEFAALPGPDADTVADLRKSLAKQPNAEESRRLNKLLLSSVFPRELQTARLSLVSSFIWRPVKVRFQVLNAQEAFMIWMKAAIMTGLVLASPYVFFQIWTFVAAGLYPNEKSYVYLYLPISIGLFLAGASLAFVFVFDPVLNFLFTFNRGMNADFDPRVGEWLSFVLILPLGFGISFQLPLVMLFLNRIGVVPLALYVQQWRIAMLIICVVSMVLTPADPISMILMAVPLCLLYLLGIVMCKYMPRSENPFGEAYEP
jgi:sec-independent protein translocase protein TatC